MKWTSFAARLTLLIEAPCGLDGARICREDRPELRPLLIVGLDSIEIEADKTFVAQCAGVDRFLNVGDAGGEQVKRTTLLLGLERSRHTELRPCRLQQVIDVPAAVLASVLFP